MKARKGDEQNVEAPGGATPGAQKGKTEVDEGDDTLTGLALRARRRRYLERRSLAQPIANIVATLAFWTGAPR
jgi:hypothetical protein